MCPPSAVGPLQVNNNPLEYWTTYDAPEYQQLMVDLETLIEAPGDRDVPLASFFPQASPPECPSHTWTAYQRPSVVYLS